ncbi:MAG: natural product biosynthesis carrier protein [Deltaproteobacteria bacterium]|nr:natural product biosynthesis carrier protein [Deltaproteobacteria bacterium]
MQESEIRKQLRAWILRRSQSKAKTELADDTPILESGLLSSLDVVELILFIENLKGAEVDVDDIEPEVLTNVNTIYDGFFRGEAA